jgi:hypothetical protein
MDKTEPLLFSAARGTGNMLYPDGSRPATQDVE